MKFLTTDTTISLSERIVIDVTVRSHKSGPHLTVFPREGKQPKWSSANSGCALHAWKKEQREYTEMEKTQMPVNMCKFYGNTYLDNTL
jgi:hypothetical protein